MSTNKRPSECLSRITPRIYLGDLTAATSDSLLWYHGITHILSVLNARHFPPSPRRTTFRIDIDDHYQANLQQWFDRVCKWMKNVLAAPHTRILIHCHAGRSRSATVTIAALMKLQRTPLLVAFDWVKLCRPVIRPNPGFLEQLAEYNQRLHDNTARKLVRYICSFLREERAIRAGLYDLLPELLFPIATS